MPSDRESRIRERAYALWEEQGRPEGQHEQHWGQAEAEHPADAADPMPPGAATVAGSDLSQSAPDSALRRRATVSDRAPAE